MTSKSLMMFFILTEIMEEDILPCGNAMYKPFSGRCNVESSAAGHTFQEAGGFISCNFHHRDLVIQDA